MSIGRQVIGVKHIPLGSKSPSQSGLTTPGLMLEFKHFISESYRKFQLMQLDILRPRLKPGGLGYA